MKWTWPTVWADERGGWWRVAVTLVLFALGCLLGNLLLLAACSAGLNDAMKNLPLHVQEMARPIAIFFNASFGLVGCLIGVRFIHHKPVACVFTDGRPFRFTFAVQSAALWLLLWFAGASLIPARWEVIQKRAGEIPLIGLVMLSVVILCTTTVQGTLEEVVFRGYLQPRVGAWVKRPWIAVLIIGLVFVAGHPDAWTAPGIIYIASFGLACGVGGVRTGTLAPLCGLHAAENAMNWLWFPHDSNAADTWPMAGVTAAGLAIWLGWLFWTTRQKPTNTLERPDIGLKHEHTHTA
ncbi:MAG: lysostaphin resistance A-like protein [Limisphaerales bacterium]